MHAVPTSKLMPDNNTFNNSFPCDVQGRGGTSDISAWEHFIWQFSGCEEMTENSIFNGTQDRTLVNYMHSMVLAYPTSSLQMTCSFFVELILSPLALLIRP